MVVLPAKAAAKALADLRAPERAGANQLVAQALAETQEGLDSRGQTALLEMLAISMLARSTTNDLSVCLGSKRVRIYIFPRC
jgi:hypothetical protein